MTRANVEYIRENGPSTVDELPNKKVHAEDKMQGLTTFQLSTKCAVSPKAVYYMLDDHDKREVLAKWCAVNGHAIDIPNFGQYVAGQGSEWRTAWVNLRNGCSTHSELNQNVEEVL